MELFDWKGLEGIDGLQGCDAFTRYGKWGAPLHGALRPQPWKRACRYPNRVQNWDNDSAASGASTTMVATSSATSTATCQLSRSRAKGKTKRQSEAVMGVREGFSPSS